MGNSILISFIRDINDFRSKARDTAKIIEPYMKRIENMYSRITLNQQDEKTLEKLRINFHHGKKSSSHQLVVESVKGLADFLEQRVQN